MYNISDILKKTLVEQSNTTITLAQHYGENYPDEDEMLWAYIAPDEFEEYHFEIININPVEIFNTWKTSGGDITLADSLEYADGDQLELIKDYRYYISDIVKELVIVANMDKLLIDGYHRIAAMAMEGITSSRAIDINS